ncbi:MAG TPA: hypothetical protein VIR32_00025, partial [Lachnospiraceae bacterium]
MKNNVILRVGQASLKKYAYKFLALELLLLGGTAISLILPEILSKYIDNLEIKENIWLAGCALLYCVTVIIGCGIHVLNNYVGEVIGWEICDSLRVNLFSHI